MNHALAVMPVHAAALQPIIHPVQKEPTMKRMTRSPVSRATESLAVAALILARRALSSLATAPLRRALSSLAVALVTLLTAVISDRAQAATAFLVRCDASTSVTGQFIYVGTYQYAGQYIERAFRSYCPYSIEVQ